MILNYHHSSTSYQSFSILNGCRSSRPQSVIVTSFIGRSFCPVSLDSICVTTSWIEKLKVSLIIWANFEKGHSCKIILAEYLPVVYHDSAYFLHEVSEICIQEEAEELLLSKLLRYRISLTSGMNDKWLNVSMCCDQTYFTEKCPFFWKLSHVIITYHSLYNFTKHNMTTIQPWGLHCCDEELGTISIFTRISHTQPARSMMLQLEVLVRKFAPINTLTYENGNTHNKVTWHSNSGFQTGFVCR